MSTGRNIAKLSRGEIYKPGLEAKYIEKFQRDTVVSLHKTFLEI